MSHLETVQGIYEAFGRGDIPWILDQIAEDARWEWWEDNRAQRAGVPYLAPQTGREGAAKFFEIVGTFEIRDFQVLDFLAGEKQVAVQVLIETSKFRDEELHLWTFGDDGKVVGLRHYVDTAKHIAANAG